MQRKISFRASKCNYIIAFLLLFLLIAILYIVFPLQNRQGAGQLTTDKIVTFTPAVIPPFAPEIVNPWRGAYNWYNEQLVPDWPFMNSYVRYNWKDIEPTEGHYDFSQIDREL